MPLVTLLLMLGAFITWVYIKFQPQGAHAATLRTVNLMFPILALVMGLLSFARVKTKYTADPGEVMIVNHLALSWGLGIAVAIMVAGFIVRNFVIFRTPRF